MDFLELEGKAQFKRFNIPVNEHTIINSEKDLETIEFPCVLKGQILSGKRGKHGAVKVVKTLEEAKSVYKDILKISINDQHMEGVISCGFLPIAEEYYLGMTLDSSSRRMLMLFTPFGGMDIEELAEKEPEKLLKFDCTKGFCKEGFIKEAAVFNLSEDRINRVVDIAEKLSTACFELDATTIEINPLVVQEDGSLIAIDAKLSIDDNAMYRQKDYTLLPRTKASSSAQEEEAEQYDLTYIEVDPNGNIGTMAGGAGIGMATMDTITYYGGKTNNFMDLGGGVTAEKTYHAMKILLNNEKTEHIFVNIFGGINNCADMAEGITRAYKEVGIKKHIVIKSRGFNQEQGWALYEELGFPQTKYGTTDEAVQTLLNDKGAK